MHFPSSVRNFSVPSIHPKLSGRSTELESSSIEFSFPNPAITETIIMISKKFESYNYNETAQTLKLSLARVTSTNNSTPRRFLSYLLLYFFFISCLPRCTLPYFLLYLLRLPCDFYLETKNRTKKSHEYKYSIQNIVHLLRCQKIRLKMVNKISNSSENKNRNFFH